MAPLLEIKNLKTRFHTEDGIVKAVNGISYTLEEGQNLASSARAAAARVCMR